MGSDGFLTTHVLDTASGVPASGVRIQLYRVDGETKTQITQTVTNHDGRTDTPLIPKGELSVGAYELIFHIGEYFTQSHSHPTPAFLDEVPVRFGISDADSHYHVPLLASPFGYSTYRGS